MRNELYLSTKYLEDSKYLDGELCVLLALNGIIVGNLQENCINRTVLSYSIYNRSVSQSEKTTINNHLTSLNKKGIISKIFAVDHSTHVYNVENVFVNTSKTTSGEYYVCISTEAFKKIMALKDVDNFKILRLYLCYINSLHKGNLVKEKYKGKVGFMPISHFENITRINRKTLLKYNEVLVKEKLIYIVHHSFQHAAVIKKHSEVQISGVTNTYSRYEDKLLCEEYASEKGGYYVQKAYDDRVFKQTYSQKYKQLFNGKEYSLTDLLNIKKYVESFNKDVKEKKRNARFLDINYVEKMIDKRKSELDNEYYDSLFAVDTVKQKKTVKEKSNANENSDWDFFTGSWED